jgi:ribulose-5-phosphate 4-epimerase/fuculose-1-phosphate aldolase
MTALPEDGPALRAAVIEAARAMNAAGINVNTSGNVSRAARAPVS